MPYAMVPPGYRAVLLGQAAAIEDLGTFTPLEEGVDEGALVLMKLDFAEFPSSEALAQLNKAFLDKGIPPWPGYDFVVYADATSPSIYLTWQKGFAWMPVIVGILVVTVLPALLGGAIWLLLPQSVKDLITGIMNLGMMMLMMWLITSMMKPLIAPAKEKPKRLEETKPAKVEEANA
jgi:hypothetical protein